MSPPSSGLKNETEETSMKTGGMVISGLAYSSALKLEETYSSETVDFQWTTWCYIPEDRTLHNHCCENLKSYEDSTILSVNT
jgi:hypothetical protein